MLDCGVLVAGEPAQKTIYLLVRELSVDGVGVTVTCGALKIAPASLGQSTPIEYETITTSPATQAA